MILLPDIFKPFTMKKKLFFTFLLCAFSSSIFAQWVSPGNGTIYTFPILETITNGIVTEGAGGYDVNQDLTISANDVLYLSGDINVNVLNNVLITINGSLQSDSLSKNHFLGKDNGYFNLCFDNATDCDVRADFTRTGGIKIIESDVIFNGCDFTHSNTQFTSGAVNYFNCNPVFINCNFIENEGAAISSGANIMGSPKIMNCTFTNNVTINENQPQINLGPGAEDTIYIVGNTITGQYDMSGGIAIANLMNTGATKALIKDNIVTNNRYGYTQQGNNIDALIICNHFIDNNLETNPMNGGSGISIYGYDETCKAKLRNNMITGNLWGITSIYHNSIDMGTEEDWGNNAIYNNGNGGALYELYNNSTNDVYAIGNYWGSNDDNYAETVIFHQPDQAGIGLVTFEPIKKLYPFFIRCGVCSIEKNNPENIVYFDGFIDENLASVIVDIPDEYYNNLQYYNVLRYEVETGVTGNPNSNTEITEDLNITLATPHGEASEWQLIIRSGTSTLEKDEMSITAFPNPVENGVLRIQNAIGERGEVSIYNSVGQLIYSVVIENKEVEISTLNWKSGIYFLKMSNGNQSTTQKIIVK
jgi:hypothetical protein